MAFLEDGEIAEVRAGAFRILDAAARPLRRATRLITWDAVAAQKGGYRHFMLKEIHEQPQAVTDTLRGRVALESGAINVAELNLAEDQLARTGKDPPRGLRDRVARRAGGQVPDRGAGAYPAEVDYGSESATAPRSWERIRYWSR